MLHGSKQYPSEVNKSSRIEEWLILKSNERHSISNMTLIDNHKQMQMIIKSISVKKVSINWH